jgi:hypothetical protein
MEVDGGDGAASADWAADCAADWSAAEWAADWSGADWTGGVAGVTGGRRAAAGVVNCCMNTVAGPGSEAAALVCLGCPSMP